MKLAIVSKSKHKHEQRSRQTDRQTDRQTNRQTNKQTDRETDRQTDGQTDGMSFRFARPEIDQVWSESVFVDYVVGTTMMRGHPFRPNFALDFNFKPL